MAAADTTVEASSLNTQQIKLLSTVDTQGRSIPEMLTIAIDKKDRMTAQLEELGVETPSIAEGSNAPSANAVARLNELSA